MKEKTCKKIEWSKLFTLGVAISFGVYGMWCGIEYYKLCKIAIDTGAQMPDSQLAVVSVTTVLASLLSYLLYQMGLKNSRNKYGIGADGQPFKQVEVDITENNSENIG